MAASRRIGSSHGPGSAGQPRQLPGPACEECRKRKLRCKECAQRKPIASLIGTDADTKPQPTGDRQRPQCGTCADAGIVCEINNNRLARGPKKGDLKALRSRIGKSQTCQESHWNEAESDSRLGAPPQHRPWRAAGLDNPYRRFHHGVNGRRSQRSLLGRGIPHACLAMSELIDLGGRNPRPGAAHDADIWPVEFLDSPLSAHAAVTTTKKHLC